MTEFEKELVRFVSGYLDAGVSAEDYVKAFSQRLLDSIGRQSNEQPVRLPSQTKEEQEMQMARFLANKKETFFQLILANLIQNSAFVQMKVGINGDLSEFKKISVRAAIDAAFEGADYAITKLYPVEKKED